MATVQLRKSKQTKTTTQMTFESESLLQMNNNIALALLTGGFNSLKQYSRNGKPIDLERLNELRDKFDELIWEVKEEMAVDLIEIGNF